MTETTYSRTDGTMPGMARWLALLIASLGTLIGVGVLWSLAPTAVGCGDVGIYTPDGSGILPGPQPCGTDGTTPALVTAGILLALLAAVFVVAFTVVKRRGMVLLILGGVMLLSFIVGLLATVITANTSPPVIYY